MTLSCNPQDPPHDQLDRPGTGGSSPDLALDSSTPFAEGFWGIQQKIKKRPYRKASIDALQLCSFYSV